MCYSLVDESRGRLKGWPGGWYVSPEGRLIRTFRHARCGERPVAVISKGKGRWVHCKYCRMHTLPLTLVEEVHGSRAEMVICSKCGAGLTPPS